MSPLLRAVKNEEYVHAHKYKRDRVYAHCRGGHIEQILVVTDEYACKHAG